MVLYFLIDGRCYPIMGDVLFVYLASCVWIYQAQTCIPLLLHMPLSWQRMFHGTRKTSQLFFWTYNEGAESSIAWRETRGKRLHRQQLYWHALFSWVGLPSLWQQVPCVGCTYLFKVRGERRYLSLKVGVLDVIFNLPWLAMYSK